MATSDPRKGHGRLDDVTANEPPRALEGLVARLRAFRSAPDPARRRLEAREREAMLQYTASTAKDAHRHLRLQDLHDLLERPGEFKELAAHLDTCEVCKANLAKVKRISSRLESYAPPCD